MPLHNSRAPEDIRWFDSLGAAIRKRLLASADSTDELVASFKQIGLSVDKGIEWESIADLQGAADR